MRFGVPVPTARITVLSASGERIERTVAVPGGRGWLRLDVDAYDTAKACWLPPDPAPEQSARRGRVVAALLGRPALLGGVLDLATIVMDFDEEFAVVGYRWLAQCVQVHAQRLSLCQPDSPSSSGGYQIIPQMRDAWVPPVSAWWSADRLRPGPGPFDGLPPFPFFSSAMAHALPPSRPFAYPTAGSVVSVYAGQSLSPYPTVGSGVSVYAGQSPCYLFAHPTAGSGVGVYAGQSLSPCHPFADWPGAGTYAGQSLPPCHPFTYWNGYGANIYAWQAYAGQAPPWTVDVTLGIGNAEEGSDGDDL